MRTKVKFHCRKCRDFFYMSKADFTQGGTCPNCGSQRIQLSEGSQLASCLANAQKFLEKKLNEKNH